MEEIVLSEEDERKVQEGTAAAALLDSPIFLLAIERVRSQCAEKILESAPEAQADRERLYNLSRGLSAVTEELLAIASLGQTTLDNATRPTDEDEVQDDPDPDEFY
jgi:hypothetical protein